MQIAPVFVCLLVAVSVSGCMPATNSPNYLQQAMKKNRLNKERSTQKISTYTEQISPLLTDCDANFTSNRYDRAVCIGNAEIRTSNKVGLPSQVRSLIAEKAALRLNYAKKIDSGAISREEAGTLFLIDVERLTDNRIAQARAKSNKSLEAIRQHSANFPRDTTCRKSGESINCTTW